MFLFGFVTLGPMVMCLGLLIWHRDQVIDLDNGTCPASFYVLLALYRRVAMTIFGIGLVLGLFFANRQETAPATFLIAAAIYGLLFTSWLTVCYEQYLAVRYRAPDLGPSNYTGHRYAVTLTFGWSAVALFVLGIVAAALTLGGW